MITIIVAVDENGGIGHKGKLPWKNKEDLAFFRETTLGHTVIMGRVTWESLPKRPLEGRRNIVVSSKDVFGAESYSDLEGVFKHLDMSEEHFIIGGTMLYEYALKKGLVDRVLISEIQGNHPADRFFEYSLLGNFVSEAFYTTSGGLMVTEYIKY